MSLYNETAPFGMRVVSDSLNKGSRSPYSPQKQESLADQATCTEVLDRYGIPQYVSKRDYRFVEDLSNRTPPKAYQST